MKRALTAVAILLLAGRAARAHRLDEYLQAAIVSIEKDRVDVQMTLTPGVAVFPMVMWDLDANSDGEISEAEKSGYVARFLGDLAMRIDGQPLKPHLRSARFPGVAEMKDGTGEIHIEFDARLPPGGTDRKLTIENRHLSQISAYQVNALVPKDPAIRISEQKRNYSQSSYEVDFRQTGVPAIAPIGIAFVAMAGLLWFRRSVTGARS
jgi:hypothetical protein